MWSNGLNRSALRMSPAYLVVVAVVCTLLIMYELCGMWCLFQDRAVVEGCSVERGTVWPTTLWHYVLVSLIFTPLAIFLVVRLPHEKVVDSIMVHCSRWRLDQATFTEHMKDHEKNFPKKFGFTVSMPDWLFMAIGTLLLFLATVSAVLALWGYNQLFVLKTQCINVEIAFKELGIWQFGYRTYIIQVALVAVLGVPGLLFLVSPLALEYTMPPKLHDPKAYDTILGPRREASSLPPPPTMMPAERP